MSTLLQSVEKFIENISVTDGQEDNIDASVKNLNNHLLDENSNLSVQDVFLNGSYKRDTIIRPLDDIDLFAVIDDSDYTNNGIDPKPQTVLTKFKNYLNSIHDYEGKVKQDRPCVTIQLSNKNFDVLPSLRKAGALYIPNNDLTSWTFTDPKTHTAQLNETNKRRHYKVKGVVKAVKQWKRENSQNIPSFHIEEVAIEVFNFYDFSNYEEGIRLWFENAESYLKTDRFNSYDEYDKVKNKVYDVKSRLAEAKRLIDDNKVGEAKKIWKDIFGREFPVLDEEDAKNIADASKKGTLKYSATTGLSTIAGSAMVASKGFYGDV